jgi:hypothetical protein
LPVGEFETLAEAESMLTLVGRRLADGEHLWSIQLPSSPSFFEAWPEGNIEGLFEAEEWITQHLAKRRIKTQTN